MNQDEINFYNWNKLKVSIEKRSRREFYVNSREVWNIHIGKNLGYESFGRGEYFTRPVLVLKLVGAMVFTVSMTTSGKNNRFYYKLKNSYFNKDSYISLSQVKVLDKKRFIEKIGKIETKDFIDIKNNLKQLLF